MKLREFIAVLVLFGILPPAAVFADCSSQNRLLREGLAQASEQTERWVVVWGTAWSAATVAQLGVAVSVQSVATRQDLMVGSVSSLLGLVPTWIRAPSITHFDPTQVRDDCSGFAENLALLDRYSREDELTTGVIAHASNLAVNLAVSLVMGAGLGHWNSAAISAAAGVPLGEMMILTYPSGAKKLRDHLKSDERGPRPEKTAFHWALLPGPGSQTLLVSLDFF